MPHSTVYLGNPLCKVALMLLAIAASSCAMATNDGPCGDSANTMAGEACDLSAETSSTRSIEEQILALVNGERENAGERPLAFSCQLAGAARDHNGRMMREGFFDHCGDSERCLFDRVTTAGMNPDSVGENLFKTSAPRSSVAQQCVAMWMQSDGHRRNLLSRDFDTTGISVSYAHGECFVTEDFARIGSALHVTRKRSSRTRNVASCQLRPRHSSRLIASRRPTHREETRDLAEPIAMGDSR
jgi:uncharacterized protein YkwD